MVDSASPLAFFADNAVMAALKDAYNSFTQRRRALGLSNPGTVDNVAREVQKEVLLSNFMFTGLRADLTKVFGMSPLFRISHAFAMGSQGNLPPYAFSSMFGTSKVSKKHIHSPLILVLSPSSELTIGKVFMQGNIGSDGALAAVGNYRWNSSFVTKTNAQIMPGAAQGLLQIDNDYAGSDFSASVKAFNPSLLEGGLTGIYIGSYLQSVTPNLALGLEAMWQRSSLNARPETAI